MVLRKEDCWYREVCTYEPCANCVRYVEMKYLMEHSGLSKKRQRPIKLKATQLFTQLTQASMISNIMLQFSF